MQDESNDERIAIDAARSGDAEAFDVLVKRYARRVMAVAWSITRNGEDSEDLAQEAFIRAFEKLEEFDSSRPFGPWILRIVTNLALDRMRHRRRFFHAPLDAGPPLESGSRSDELAERHELRRRIDQAIEALPEMQRVIARLILVDQFDSAEVAGMTGLAEGTVRSHLSLARAKLRNALADSR